MDDSTGVLLPHPSSSDNLATVRSVTDDAVYCYLQDVEVAVFGFSGGTFFTGTEVGRRTRMIAEEIAITPY